MVKETEKKVDDYYSSIRKDSSDSSSKSKIKGKLKIKPKLAKIVKKVDTVNKSNENKAPVVNKTSGVVNKTSGEKKPFVKNNSN
ncbi:MAG: hypothetical protein U9Q66_03035 [Patescibacteria group bacterium]|nr:hypothetical protein [Patescibacteria group bacterium]